ncbi:transcriptional regulatory [Fusarium heterosporum]|uniref:Cofilin n=1 Tax=Fusarium heterosporum TaxID=42747 RepID=A0A8H5TV61_FUSHE|nr:transcriptional regulatory [Fusarium heterosporum]
MSGEETILARRARLSQVPRACEACKVRKIRCDRVYPCGNCKAAGIACQQQSHPHPVQSDARPRQDNRISQLEEYVHTLEARLAKVESRLDTQTPTLPSTSTSASTPSVAPPKHTSPATSSNPSIHDVAPSPVGPLYEGSSSFINQFVRASEEIQRSAVAETPEAAQTLTESFNQLNTILNDQEEKKPSVAAVSRSVPEVSSPPATVVLAILRKIKGTNFPYFQYHANNAAQPTKFLPGQAVTDIRLIEHFCQKVYFPSEPVTLGDITSVNGMMRLILREFIITEESLGPEYDLKELKAQAERNFDLGLETFEMLTVPSFENVLVITTAILKIQNESKPVLARALINAGLCHCQMLGYQNESTLQKDKSGFAEHKRRLFWTLYVFDKTNSLHLGHASRVQDFEIDANYPKIPDDPAEKPWTELFHLVIRLAKTQGLIFEKLYSAAGLRSPAVERRQWIDSLVADMHQWRRELEMLDGSRVRYVKMLELSLTHWDIMYYATLTTLLRAPAMPGVGTDMTSQCFQAARLALQSHLRAFSGYGGQKMFSKADYIDWALHNSSFTPFVVIFLHSIAAASLEDVNLLEQVVNTFRSAREIHAGAEKLYEICNTFARLARRMVESRNTSVGMYDQNTDSLQVFGVSEGVPLSWHECGAQPSGGNVEGDGFTGFLNDDMTSILADWINGQPPDMFTMDFEVSIAGECITAANSLRFSKGPNRVKYVIFKISDDEQSVVVEETSSGTDYETFRQRLLSGVDKSGNPAPRYAVYDVDYDLGEDGKRTKTVFVSWVPINAPIKLRMLYASTMEYLKKSVNVGVFIHADDAEDLEWGQMLNVASDGKAK